MTEEANQSVKRHWTTEEAGYYQSLGYFVISFERLVEEIRNFIVESLVCDGLKSKETAHYLLVNFNNPQLQNYLGAVFKYAFSSSVEDHERLVRFGKKFQECFEFRNNLIHAIQNFRFYPTPSRPLKVTATKVSRSTKALQYRDMPVKQADIDVCSDVIHHLTDEMHRGRSYLADCKNLEGFKWRMKWDIEIPIPTPQGRK